MAANTSKYMYVVGYQPFDGDQWADPWAIVMLTESLPDAKECVQEWIGPQNSIHNADVKRNDYWFTGRLRTADPEAPEFFMDIQRVKVEPVKIAPVRRNRGPKGSVRGPIRSLGSVAASGGLPGDEGDGDRGPLLDPADGGAVRLTG